jgi:hypothetical protein
VTPTQRSLAVLRAEGHVVAVVEHWNPHARCRQDFLGFADLIACHPHHGITAIQTTTDDHRAHRRAKIAASENARAWLAAGGKIRLHTWGKHPDLHGRKVWRVHDESITDAAGEISITG